MSYTQITAHVVDQTLQLANLPDLASGGVGNILVKFDFCELWDGYGKTAVFYRNPADVYHITIVDNTAEVPHEVMPDKGYFFFGVMGAADNVRTTEVIRVEYKQGAITAATANHKEPTPDIYQQLLAAYGLLEARFNNIITAGTPEDGELVDIRVGWDGETYESAGAAVRSQFAQALAATVEYNASTGLCNWKAYEIFDLVHKGRRAVFRTNDMSYIPLTYVDQSIMRFERVTTDDTGRTIRKAFIIDNDGNLTESWTTLVAQEALDGMISDSRIVPYYTWSSKNIVDKLCPAFEESGLIVTCEPVEGYPLAVAADAEATAITRCGKNMIKHEATTTTKSGVTFTVNEDKTITVNGTATGTIYFTVGTAKLVSGVEYWISGCPAGGNGATYYLYHGSANTVMDQGSGKKLTVSKTTTGTVYFYVAKGLTINDAVIKPMVRQADTPSTYEPPKAVETFNPGEPIPALPGINTIFADAGEITVTGRTDPNAINRKTAERLAALEAALVNT